MLEPCIAQKRRETNLIRLFVDELELFSRQTLGRAGTRLVTPATRLIVRFSGWDVHGLRPVVLEASIERGGHVEPWIFCSSNRERFWACRVVLDGLWLAGAPIVINPLYLRLSVQDGWDDWVPLAALLQQALSTQS